MLRKLASLIEHRAFTIVAITIIITLVFATQLPGIKFETAIERYLPDDEIGRANERVMNYFGEEQKLHFVYIQAKNSNVLTNTSLREQYKIIEEIRSLNGVEETASIADIINILCKWSLDPISMSWKYHENNSIATSTDNQISARVELALQILNGTLELPMTDVTMLTSGGDIDFLIKLLLSKDFNPENFNELGSTPKATLIVVNLNGTLTTAETKKLSNEIRELTNRIEFKEISVAHTGESLVAYEVDQSSNQSNKILISAIFVLIAISLAVLFKKFSYVILPLLTLIVIAIWTFASMCLIQMKFTALIVGVLPLIFGLGIDYPVHISVRYQEELRRGKSVNESLRISITHVGVAILLCAITTIVAFSSNIFSPIPPIRDFGIMCATGIFFSFLLVLILYSSTRYLVDKKKRGVNAVTKVTAKNSRNDLLDKAMAAASTVSRKHNLKVIFVVIIITSLSIFGATHLKTEFSLESFLPDDWESVNTQKMIRNDFEAGAYTESYILIEGDVATPETLSAIDKIETNIKDDTHIVKVSSDNLSIPLITSIRTLIKKAVEIHPELMDDFNITANATPTEQCQRNDVIRLYNYLYSSNETADSLTGKSFSEEAKKVLHKDADLNYDATVIRIYVNAHTSTQNREMYNELKVDVTDYSGKLTITGGMVLMITTLDSLQDSQIISTLICILVAAIILILIYRRIISGLITLIPVILSALWILGTMYLTSIPLNVLTVTVTALTIGCGVDYAIHIKERFMEESKKRSVEDAVHSTIKTTGRAVAISALTTFFGFSVLMLSPMPILQQYGFITAITIMYCFISAVLVFPIVLVIWAKHEDKILKSNM